MADCVKMTLDVELNEASVTVFEGFVRSLDRLEELANRIEKLIKVKATAIEMQPTTGMFTARILCMAEGCDVEGANQTRSCYKCQRRFCHHAHIHLHNGRWLCNECRASEPADLEWEAREIWRDEFKNGAVVSTRQSGPENHRSWTSTVTMKEAGRLAESFTGSPWCAPMVHLKMCVKWGNIQWEPWAHRPQPYPDGLQLMVPLLVHRGSLLDAVKELDITVCDAIHGLEELYDAPVRDMVREREMKQSAD